MTQTVLLSAVEPSADAMGAGLMRSLRSAMPEGVRFVGCGGTAMAEEGLASAFDIAPFSVMGVGDALAAAPAALRSARALAALAARERAEAAVLIDAWGFSRLTAREMRRRAPAAALVKLAAPQVWASRPNRTAFVAAHFDLVLTLLPFEAPIFEAAGVRSVFVGNPNFEAVAATPRSGPGFRARHKLGGAPVLVVLPGSRRGEVARHMRIFGDAARDAIERVPSLRVVVVAATSVEDQVRSAAAAWLPRPLIVGASERFDAFDAADAGLAASGTVTTELAVCGTPMVVAYRVGRLTAAWARRVMITDTVTILNLAAGEKIVPERLQEACTPEQLCADIVRLLTDDEARRRQTSAFRRVLPDLIGSGRATDRAAAEIVRLLKGEDRPDLDASA